MRIVNYKASYVWVKQASEGYLIYYKNSLIFWLRYSGVPRNDSDDE